MVAETVVILALLASSTVPGAVAVQEYHSVDTYEIAGASLRTFILSVDVCFGLSPTADGQCDVGGVVYDGCLSPNHARNGGDPRRDLPCGTTAPDTLTVDLTDTVFLSDVGAFICADRNGDFDCRDESDVQFGFCDGKTFQLDTSVFFSIKVGVDDAVWQPLDCPGTSNPVGGIAGTIELWATVN